MSAEIKLPNNNRFYDPNTYGLMRNGVNSMFNNRNNIDSYILHG